MGLILVTNFLPNVLIYYILENLLVYIRNKIMFLLNLASSVAGYNGFNIPINHSNTGNDTNVLTIWCMY